LFPEKEPPSQYFKYLANGQANKYNSLRDVPVVEERVHQAVGGEIAIVQLDGRRVRVR
jgi:hypothetical protein